MTCAVTPCHNNTEVTTTSASLPDLYWAQTTYSFEECVVVAEKIEEKKHQPRHHSANQARTCYNYGTEALINGCLMYAPTNSVLFTYCLSKTTMVYKTEWQQPTSSTHTVHRPFPGQSASQDATHSSGWWVLLTSGLYISIFSSMLFKRKHWNKFQMSYQLKREQRRGYWRKPD